MRLYLEGKREPFSELMVFTSRFDELMLEAGQETAAEITPGVLAELEVQPPERTGETEVDWTSERQRRAYFATDGFGAGIPYKRTGGLARAWRIITEIVGEGKFRLMVENPAKAARFVYGSLARDIGQAKRFQQRFHIQQGWLTASPIVHKWIDLAQELFQANMDKKIVALGIKLRKRAITPRLGR